MTKYDRIKELMELYGHDITHGMLILVMGQTLLHWFIRRFRAYIDKHKAQREPMACQKDLVDSLHYPAVLCSEYLPGTNRP